MGAVEQLLDVVVVNYRTPDLMQRCLTSLQEFVVPRLEGGVSIWDIDTSPTSERVGRYGVENRGYGFACNYGASLGVAPYILFLNADTEATEDSVIESMLDTFMCTDMLAALGPKQVDNVGRLTSAGQPLLPDGIGYYTRGWHEIDSGQYSEPIIDCAYVTGSIIMVDRQIFSTIGGLLETEHYYEETWLCYRARQLGYRVCYTGTSRWLHHWDSSPKTEQGEPIRDISRRSYAVFEAACREVGMTPAPFYPEFPVLPPKSGR